MESPADIINLAHAIQQAVAPVFLLTGVGAILNVLSGRLSRVVDRFRALDKIEGDERVKYTTEIASLLHRARWINWAISLCTLCALFICIVIAALFIGSGLGKDPSIMIAGFFIIAMLSLTVALLCFLREIALARGSISMRKQ
jgi:Protein of unknown function (DUF2721)